MFIKFLSRARPLPYSLLRRALRRFIACPLFVSVTLSGGDPEAALPCSAVWLCVFVLQ